MMTNPDQAGFTADGLGNFISETPGEGNTEIWEIVNLTMDAHPIHTHLVQFQLLNRQTFDLEKYNTAYGAAFVKGGFQPGFGPPLDYAPSAASGGKYGGNPDVTPFLNGAIMPPNANEAGWKDTVMAPPGTVTRFVVRFAPTDIAIGGTGGNSNTLHYSFLPNDNIPGNPGAQFDYVWHCHIVDHEDNEMMRPDIILPKSGVLRSYKIGVDY